jgi:carbonic anhydrase
VDLDALLRANRQYARTFAHAALPSRPTREIAILTCMDVRIDPLALVGMGLGDAHVVRNAGGRAVDALRSLAVSCELFDTRRILAIHHTDCGMEGVDDAVLAARFEERSPGSAQGVAFHGFADLAESVREDVALLRGSTLIPPHVRIDGLVYDVRSGLLEEIA